MDNERRDDLVLDVPDVVKLEQAIAAAGTSLATLMRRAGIAIATTVMREQPNRSKPVAILAGSGNNGGDGWVAAEVLAQEGYPVSVVSTKQPSELRAQPACDAAQRALQAGGFDMLVVGADDRCDQAVEQACVVVDALLGTGFEGSKMRPSYAACIDAANRAHERGALVIAADVPSGLSAQTGQMAQPCIHADITVTMMVKKPGLLSPAGRECCGRVEVADIADIAPFLP